MESAAVYLLSHPEVFEKAKEEIDANVKHFRLLDRTDLAKLPYLHCIINESLRLASTGQIIPLHESSGKCTVRGYGIPHSTILFVNTWVLHRDPNLWVDPNIFKPERFQGREREKGGFKFIPLWLTKKAVAWSRIGYEGDGLVIRNPDSVLRVGKHWGR
ncbi:Cytochrome P450 [Melia azedarach]|uniref:Cytochrome P450 n=1 Tax=Melia azedarach TaxID=155640 RepID=A0ACC1WRS0_MELAZ|nr:Cytochrome P450 [Melia azedarach]